MDARASARAIAIALAGLAYVAGSHWLMTGAPESPWNLVGVLSPMLVAIAVGAWRGGQRVVAVAAAALVAGLCVQALAGAKLSAPAVYAAQHIGINLFLAALFGGSLRAGHTPLITSLAGRIHGAMTVGHQAYTRKVTIAWTVYFLAMALSSLLLFRLAPFDAWAVFANLLTPLAVALMFVGEHLVRYRLHPEFARVGIAQAARAFMRPEPASRGRDRAA